MQYHLFKTDADKKRDFFINPNFASNKLKPVHRWVPWIAGFSSDFVKSTIDHYLPQKGVVLDPFSGVGTTLVEASLAGNHAIGFEINPYAALACRVKMSSGKIDINILRETQTQLNTFYRAAWRSNDLPKSFPPEKFKTRIPFYSPLVLKKVLIIQDFINSLSNPNIANIFKLAFAATMVSYSNYSYEPSLGTRRAAGKNDINDFNVIEQLLCKIQEMVEDISKLSIAIKTESRVINDSFFRYAEYIQPESIDLCITSPPYLNNYHYIRNTRPQLYWLGFINNPRDADFLEQENFGKYWQTVREMKPIKLDIPNAPDKLITQLQELAKINNDRGIYGGQGWANYATSYFNDCYRFSQGLEYSLKENGQAFVVIGNSILQGLMVPTDQYLGEIAECAGLKLVDIHIPRSTRVGNSIIQSNVRVEKAQDNHQLYESVVHLIKKK